MIKRDSEGEVFFRQTRVTQYGRTFGIYKFRTMVKNAESLGAQVTSQNDMRVTKVGNMLRSCRLDELPQLINILLGDMSFVGTRPEVPRYVAAYTDAVSYTHLDVYKRQVFILFTKNCAVLLQKARWYLSLQIFEIRIN